MRRIVATFLSVSMLGLVACTTDPYTGEKRVSRTAIGAGAGALVGAGIMKNGSAKILGKR